MGYYPPLAIAAWVFEGSCMRRSPMAQASLPMLTVRMVGRGLHSPRTDSSIRTGCVRLNIGT